MNKSDLKNFAIGARLALLQRVSDRAALYGVTEETAQARAIAPSAAFHKTDGSVMAAAEIAQRNALIARVYQIGFRSAMEEAAYTWFNRLIALKYMQEHSRLPIPVRPLPDAPGAQPRLLLEAQDVALPGVERERVLALLEGNQTDALYKYLLIALCNALAEPLPGMFEKISDATELLFPDGLLHADSVLAEMARLDTDSWQEIQVIGWLYQFYFSQRHEEVVDINGSSIAKADIPAATCLYTTDWVVRYMVENSLGRLWLEGHPNAELRAQWRYFMDEAPQEPAVAQQLTALRQSASALRPEQLTVLDPCMGSGHILVYAFDVLMQIYRSVGYTDRDAVQSILENNLFGLDIDDRAAQLAYFAVMMKACEYDRRFLRRGVQPHVCAIAESQPLDAAALAAFGPERELAQRLLDAFRDAKEYGSLLRPDFTEAELRRLDDRLTAMTAAQDSLFAIADSQTAAAALRPLLVQAHMLTGQYDAVITNPPYMNKFSANLKRFVQEHYADYKADLFSVFMHHNFELCRKNGYTAFMSPFVWMFIKSYEKLREEIIHQKCIVTLIQMEYSAFEEATVPICTFVLRNMRLNYKGNYLRLSDFKGGMDVQNEMVLKAQEDPACKYRYAAQQDNFSKIPGAPVAYWVSERLVSAFKNGKPLEMLGASRSGMQTGDNNLFLRLWHEVAFKKIKFGTLSTDNLMKIVQKWFPQPKGGAYRKWYGNLEYVVDFKNNGESLRNFPGTSIIKNPQFYFKEGVSWSHTTSKYFSGRLMPKGCIFNVESPAFYAHDEKMLYFFLAFSNTKILDLLFGMISQTMHYMAGDMAKIPIISNPDTTLLKKIDELAIANVDFSMQDWNNFETSWDFKKHPMI